MRFQESTSDFKDHKEDFINCFKVFRNIYGLVVQFKDP